MPPPVPSSTSSRPCSPGSLPATWWNTCTARPSSACSGPRPSPGKDLPGQAQDPPRDRRLHHSGDPPQRLLWRRAGAIRRAYAVVQEPAHPRPARTQRARPAVAVVPRLPPGDRFHRRHDRQLRHGNGPGNDRTLEPLLNGRAHTAAAANCSWSSSCNASRASRSLSPGACRHSPSPPRRQASSRASQASSRVRAPIIRAAPLMRWACSASLALSPSRRRMARRWRS